MDSHTLGADLGGGPGSRPGNNKATKATKPQKQQGHKSNKATKMSLFKDFTSFSSAPPCLGFSRISRDFQGPWPWIFKGSTSFSKAPALDFLPILLILPILPILRVVSILPILPILPILRICLRICQHLSISQVKVLTEISGSIFNREIDKY